jgi:hypothetical protein
MLWRNPDTESDETVVVVAGGHNNTSPLSTSELLFVDNATSIWLPGPELPECMQFATMVDVGGGLVITDGVAVFRLSDPVNGSWTQVMAHTDRSKMAAFLVPDDLVQCS